MKIELDPKDIEALMRGYTEVVTGQAKARTERTRTLMREVVKAIPTLIGAAIKALSPQEPPRLF